MFDISSGVCCMAIVTVNLPPVGLKEAKIAEFTTPRQRRKVADPSTPGERQVCLHPIPHLAQLLVFAGAVPALEHPAMILAAARAHGLGFHRAGTRAPASGDRPRSSRVCALSRVTAQRTSSANTPRRQSCTGASPRAPAPGLTAIQPHQSAMRDPPACVHTVAASSFDAALSTITARRRQAESPEDPRSFTGILPSTLPTRFDHLFSHLPVTRQLAAGDGDHPRRVAARSRPGATSPWAICRAGGSTGRSPAQLPTTSTGR